MLRFASNLSMMFTEAPFLDRFALAAQAGFAGVEYLFPYDFDKAEIVDRLKANGLAQVLFNLPAGNWAAGERGIACHPDRRDEFRAGVAQAIDYAQALGNRQVNCLAGIVPAGLARADAHAVLRDNLTYAARELKAAGIRLIVEPINDYDIPGFALNRSAETLALLDATGEDIGLQYDIYHMQRMEGELAATLTRLLPRIAHIQIADNPGRNEPGTGEINYPFLFRHIAGLGYGGWIGCEYKPKTTTMEGLGWRAAMGLAG